MKVLKATSYVAVPAFIISSVYFLYYGLYSWRQPHYFTIHTDQQLADNTHIKIAQYISSNKLITQQAKALYLSLRQKLPLIESICLNYKPGHVVDIFCSIAPAHALLASNNGKRLCITQSGLIIQPHYFAPQTLKDLPSITIKDPALILGSLQGQLSNFLQQLPTNYFGQYDITWFDKTTIIMKQQSIQPIINLILHSSSLPLDMTALEHLQRFLTTEKITAQQEWYIDLRFKNYLIVSKRSKNNEKSSII